MKKKIQLCAILSLLFLVFIIGMKTTFDGYYSFYYEDGQYEKPVVYQATEVMTKIPPINFFMAYTGFDTGYGFFAPNVASDFVLMFEIQDSLGRTIQQTAMPNFKQKESRVRYTSVFNMFLERLKKQDPKEKDQYAAYLDIILRQIALNVKRDYPNAASVKAKLYLYDYPSFENYSHGDKKEKAILITEFKV
jgi:hypothetical protein